MLEICEWDLLNGGPTKEEGVVLKNARIVKKGTSKANVASGSVVETLVILSSNIVQIIAQASIQQTRRTMAAASQPVGFQRVLKPVEGASETRKPCLKENEMHRGPNGDWIMDDSSLY
ncbi:PREDICTED: uncharacterized protein LOC104706404 [Camelina sativa]|uniref:Uncharacterized protein LOC104706404 n=1 Tax=Camelina sativa TaxID=90675 RepID=A0ABM0T4U2_CAMSA|nr:PREDICTED: uncharacterized protein LOC104706404 [Camelina sativa]XP_010420899.1 PREDICTED: uncharacterized protein LOC104706404 [Camelina sativa]